METSPVEVDHDVGQSVADDGGREREWRQTDWSHSQLKGYPSHPNSGQEARFLSLVTGRPNLNLALGLGWRKGLILEKD